jgi:hypothetical protein
MTIHAETHAVIHRPLGDRLVRQIAVTRLAVDAGADVRRVVEADVGFVREAVHPLPGISTPFSE